MMKYRYYNNENNKNIMFLIFYGCKLVLLESWFYNDAYLIFYYNNLKNTF